MSDLATLSAKKLHEVIARRNARWDEMLSATLAAGMGAYLHSDMVEAAKGSALSSQANLARDYLNARHDWKVAKDELDARMAFHGSDKPIRNATSNPSHATKNTPQTTPGDEQMNQLAIETHNAMIAEMKAAAGFLRNAKIDLETGATKATALRTIEGGLRRLEAAISLFDAA